MKNLSNIRKQIDAVDRDIITLLERRLSLVREVARIKNNEVSIPLTDLKREDKIIQSLQKQTHDLVLQEAIADVYKVLFSVSKTIRHLEKETMCPFTHVGIIGDGLIGRSILKALQAKKFSKITIRNREWKVDDYSKCDLIIIATPIDTVIEIAMSLYKNHESLRPRAVIIDVASVKDKIAKKFDQLNNPRLGTAPIFVPTHPMGGRQERGSAYAQAILFAGRPWIITPLKNIRDNTLKEVSQFISYCGSHPVTLSAKQHDKFVAYVSHVPGILSKYLLDFVTLESPDSLLLAGSGFESMTRIGKSDNVRMRSQIAELNAKNMQFIADNFIDYMRHQKIQSWKIS